MSSLRFWSALLLGLTLALPAAAAEEDPGTQELIQQGIALRKGGKDDAALGVFLEAEKRSPASVRVLLHVTTAAQATGRWMLAYRYLQKANLYRDDPYYQRYRSSIRSIEDVLAQHLGRLRVLGTPSGADVLVNGESVGALPLAEPKVLEAGSYVLEVRKSGYFPLRRSITITSGLALSQESIALNQSSGVLPPTGVESTAQAGAPSASVEARPSPWRAPWITWTLAGTSAALLTTSAVSFVIRENKAEHWNDDALCLDASNPGASREDVCGDVQSSAERAQTVGIVTGALGVGFAGAAIAHFVWSGEDHHGQERSAGGPSTSCGVGLGNLVCRGTF